MSKRSSGRNSIGSKPQIRVFKYSILRVLFVRVTYSYFSRYRVFSSTSFILERIRYYLKMAKAFVSKASSGAPDLLRNILISNLIY